MTDILIIGGGAAAMTAALYASRGGHSVTLIERSATGGQIADSPKVENFPGIPSISGLDLASKMFDQIVEKGVDCEMDEIHSLEKTENGFIAKGDFGDYEGKCAILATGVTHRHLGIEGEEKYLGKGVSYCAVCDGPFYTGKRTMVIGDANSALQYALMLAKTSTHVDVVTLFDHFFADEALVSALKKLDNVTITHNMNSVKFYGDANLKGVLFKNRITGEEKAIETDGCFVAIGQVPDSDRFSSLIELEKGFILTDESMRTKTPGLFAAGDCRKKKIRQLTTACNDGAIAALSASAYLSSQIS